MSLKESLEACGHLVQKDVLELSDEMLQGIRDSVSDPTGLHPFMQEQIEQSDDLSAQIVRLQAALSDQTAKFEDYKSTQEAQQANYDAQRILDAKKQRRHEWLIAFASAGITQILNFIVNHFEEIAIFFRELFH